MEAIIKEVYESRFGAAYETYKEVVKKGNSIRLQDVKHHLRKRDDIQVKPKPRGSNSFVSPGAKFEFEIDIMDMESKMRLLIPDVVLLLLIMLPELLRLLRFKIELLNQ